jgi:hypothetical protein
MRRIVLLAATLLLSACAPARLEPPQVASSKLAAPRSYRAMVAAANPQAVDAGLAVLRAGGGAVDAAVAVQAVLGLAEPQSSGLGGGAFLMVYDARTGKVSAYDGRETAPAAATPALFLDEAGKPLPFRQAVMSGPLDRRAGSGGHAGAGASRPWPAVVGLSVRRTRPIGPGRLHRPAAPAAGDRRLGSGPHGRGRPPVP